MANEDNQSLISFSTLGDYRNEGSNDGAGPSQIDNSVIQAMIQRMDRLEKLTNKLGKDNETFRSLAFDLQQERNELKKKNDELEKKVNELMIFKENTELANRERDFQIEDVRKTTKCFSKKIKREIAGLKQLKGNETHSETDSEEDEDLVPIHPSFDETPGIKAEVRNVLEAMAAGLGKNFNLKFDCWKNLEMSEAGWTIRHQSSHECCGGDGFWKLWILFNGKRVDFQADADEIDHLDGVSYNSAKKLTPDSNGQVKLRGLWSYVSWNITIGQ